MKLVLLRIVEQKHLFQCHPLFDYMRLERLEPRQRLAFLPAMAYFVAACDDLKECAHHGDSRLGESEGRLLGHRSRNEDHHWPRYLQDLFLLGFDTHANILEWTRFLWSRETRTSRMLVQKLQMILGAASELERIVVVESIEEAMGVLFHQIAHVAKAFESRGWISLRWCETFHHERESEHRSWSDASAISRIELDQPTRERCTQLCNEVFALFDAWMDELLRYVVEHPVDGCAVPVHDEMRRVAAS